MSLRKAAEMALEALEDIFGKEKKDVGAINALRQALAEPVDLARVGEVGVWGKVLQNKVECEPQEAVTEDGWCQWVCPKPNGYLMQCCDCELVHEVDFRVVKYEPRPSEAFEVVDNVNLQAQMRLRRRDDISPPRREWVGLSDEEKCDVLEDATGDGGHVYYDTFFRTIEAKLKEKNG